MNISVPSRFACLKIEDDDSKPAMQNTIINKKKPQSPSENKTSKKSSVSSYPKKATQNQSTTSINKQKNLSSGRNKNKNKQLTDKQWEEWKKKDSEIVNDYFEQDMEYAILQSKLEYEANKNKNSHVLVLENTRENKEKSTINSNKKKKNKTIQLAEFLASGDSKDVPTKTTILIQPNDNKKDAISFFDEMKEAATREISKGMLEEQRKERDINFEKLISLTQCQEKLVKMQLHNNELEKELDEVKSELTTVKERNRIFCSILGKGEMKDKSELLLELDRLNKIKDELTDEVTHLHKLLEQERSRNPSLNEPSSHKHKEKNKK